MKHLNLTVDGLRAHPCASREITRILRAEEGVIRVYPNPPIDTVYVAYDPWITGPARLVRVLARAGWRVRLPADAAGGGDTRREKGNAGRRPRDGEATAPGLGRQDASGSAGG